MKEILSNIKKLALTSKYQNLLFLSKEINNIKIFKNDCDFSQIQHFFLKYLFQIYYIHQDVANKHVSEHVLEDEIYLDSYLYWKENKKDNIQPREKASDIKLVSSDNIIFPDKKEVK